jgi:hypothetical protein
LHSGGAICIERASALGLYTHVDLHDQTVAIAALPGPPTAKKNDGAADAGQPEAASDDGRAGNALERLFADFHSMRHLFITSLERAGISSKMA